MTRMAKEKIRVMERSVVLCVQGQQLWAATEAQWLLLAEESHS